MNKKSQILSLKVQRLMLINEFMDSGRITWKILMLIGFMGLVILMILSIFNIKSDLTVFFNGAVLGLFLAGMIMQLMNLKFLKRWLKD
jgi:hypothetical protein